MDLMQRFFAHAVLELRLRQSRGSAFEGLFKAVMQRRFAGFTPMEPYGSIGDRKNDGYVPETGTYYQLYAPKNPGDSVGAAAEKARHDFDGLKEFWHARCPIREYRFAFNDQFGGSVVPVETAMLDIAKAHGIAARPFLCKDVQAEALKLSVYELQDVLGTVFPEPGLLPDASYEAVRSVVEHVLNASAPVVPPGRLVAPELGEKIRFNGLSREIGSLLEAAALQSGVIDDYFSLRSGTYRQDLRDHLAAVYAGEREVAAGNGSGPDAIFVAVLQIITPRAERMAAAVQDAALVVMAYYFESCDIGEVPNAHA